MKTETTILGLRSAIAQRKRSGEVIGFVPTMGNLHAGHLSLVKHASQRCDVVVVSIFVNPTQFGEGEDFDSYPRTLEADQHKLADVGCDIVFAPTADDIYVQIPPICQVKVAKEATNKLCGISRPDHFSGMATIVNKLFNIVQPDLAFFGHKDYQQLMIIKQLVQDFNFPIEVVGIPIERAEDGLALSSRNGYLTPEQRAIAPLLQQTLQSIAQQLQASRDELTDLTTVIRDLTRASSQQLTQHGFDVDYLEVLTTDLEPPTSPTDDLIILVAAALGETRLIDNLRVAEVTLQ